MKTLKFAVGMGIMGLAVLTGPVQAYVVDWTKSYQTTEIASHMEGTYTKASLLSNYYNWDRSVQLWQLFFGPDDTSLSGISLQLQYARWYGENGTIDLNIYEGMGVQGKLVSSTKLEWDKPFDGGWFGFKLDVPVKLSSTRSYTFSLENLIIDRSLGVVTDVNRDGMCYMQQGYFGMLAGPRGYVRASSNEGINYILWK